MTTRLQAGTLINDRYQLGEKLGEGGMAVVYLARDLRTGMDVALKLMHFQFARPDLKRFVREFRAVSTLDHGNCIRVFDFGESSVGPFFTMELFRGLPLTALQGRPLPIVLDALYQAASALEYVHERGIVHRDVKPSNLLVRVQPSVDGGNPSVEVKLTDFGLARLPERPSSISSESLFLGTIQYCAPEQIRRGAVDRRADLYALGEIGYELLTGRHPFETPIRDGIESLMRAKLSGDIPPMSAADDAAPSGVEAAVMALLALEPADRPDSASALRLAAGTALGQDSPATTPSPAAGHTWSRKPFVGRALDLEVCKRLFREAVSPHELSLADGSRDPLPSVLFMVGEPGIGKTELQRELARIARSDGVSVYEGRCFEGNVAPYQPFVDVLRQLLLDQRLGAGRQDPGQARPGATRLVHVGETVAATGGVRVPGESGVSDGDEGYGPALESLVSEYAAELLRVAPDLRRWLPGEAFRQIDLNRELHYVLRAVATFFVELAAFRATCLFFEDLQWADQSTLSLLQHLSAGLLRARELSRDSNLSWPRLFICCTSRPGYEDTARFITRLTSERQAHRLDLAAFSKGEVRELAGAVLGSDPGALPESVLDPLYRCCRGNPLFVEEMIRAWRTDRQLLREGGAWQLRPTQSEAGGWPDSIRDVLRARLAPLSPDARLVLGSAAVVGAVIDIDVLRAACREMPDSSFLDAVDELLAARLLFEVGTKPDLEFAHDLVRDLAYTEVSSSRRHIMHGRVGEVLEDRLARGFASTPETLALHFSAAGTREKACRYLVAAGESAVRSYAVEHAIRHLSKARELATDSTDPQLLVQLKELLATAYSAAGQPLRAIEVCEELLAGASDVGMRARTLAKLGDLHFRVGDFDQAVGHLDRAVEALHRPRPRSAVSAAIKGALGFLPVVLPEWLGRVRRLEEPERALAIVAREAYNSATYMWAQRNVFHCAYATARQWRLARQIADPAHLADAYAKHAIFFGFLGLNSLALRASRRALSFAMSDGHPEVVAMARGHVGLVHYFGAQFGEAEDLLRQALRVLDQRGDSWVRMLLYHTLRHLYATTGDAEREMSCAQVETEIGERVDDPEGRCWGAFGMANALARTGRCAEAEVQMRRAREAVANRTNIIVLPTMLQTWGFVHIQAGDYVQARQVLEDARRGIEKNWAYVDYPIRTYPLLVESILGPAWHREAHGLSPADVAAAWQASRRAVLFGRVFPSYLPHAWRVRGRAAYVRGSRTAALGYFRRAVQAASTIGARYDLARAHLDLAKADAHDAANHEQAGRTLLEALGAVPPERERD
jgi:eukaryotic-like serine/threonine-protein kinase